MKKDKAVRRKFIQIPDMILPGLYFFRRRERSRGFRSLILCGIPAFVFISVSEEFFLTVRSLAYAIYLIITGEMAVGTVFHAEMIEHAVAALTMVFWFIISWMHHRRMIFCALNPGPEPLPPWRQTFAAMMRHPVQRWAFRGLIGLSLMILLSPWITPYDPLEQKDLSVTRLAEPLTPLYYLATESSPTRHSGERKTAPESFFSVRRKLLNPENPGVYAGSVFIRNDSVFYKQGITTKALPVSSLKGGSPDGSVVVIRSWFGRDAYGRDVLSRLIAGARISFFVSVLSVTLAVAIGAMIGAVAGYAGGFVDTLLMRFTDMMLAFPVIFLILLLMGLWGPSAAMLVLVIGLSGWMGVARLVRAEVMAIKEKEYILAARALGFRPARILIRHIMPNAMTPVIVSATLRIGTVMMVEAGLSFLGLGIQPPAPSWGNMIHEGRAFLPDAWWISAFPGMALVVTVILFNILGDGLRDARDKRLG